MRFLLIFAIPALALADTNFYVDPDWTGTSAGTASQPFNVLNDASWTSINTALASGNVTLYFSALKTDGTQQSKNWFIQCRRTSPSANRLTLDGYSQYNTDETTPTWAANPDSDINHAYLNGKVFKTTGNGSQAIGWARTDGNDFVLHNGLSYCCIESHIASCDSEPGVGANWQIYWDQHGSGSSDWVYGTNYKCYPKQNNVTVRGFEITGSGARAAFAGDSFVYEYNYLHDITSIGAGLTLLYTSFPDSSSAQIITRPSTNLTFRNFKIVNTFGEGFYLGSINPSATAAFQSAHGNQHSHILIENFVIDHPGVNGGQGDGVDCKNGITYLTIRLGEITGFGVGGNGINIGYSATNTDQQILVERNFVHDSTHDDLGAQTAILAQTGGATGTSLYGYYGVTIRNNIVANCRGGITFSGSTSQPATYGYIFNNTVYNITPNAGLSSLLNVSNVTVENNVVMCGTNPRGWLNSTGVISDYNAHDGTWTSANEGTHTLALTGAAALGSVVDSSGLNFHLVSNAPLVGAGATIGSFSDDYAGTTRIVPWDIGAYAYTP